MNSNPAKTFTRGKWAALFLALLIVPEFAFAQTPNKPTAKPPAKPAQTKTAPAPAKPPVNSQHNGSGGQQGSGGTGTGNGGHVGPGGTGAGNGGHAGPGGTGTGNGGHAGPGGTGTGNGGHAGPGSTAPLPGGGTRDTRSDGSSVDRDSKGRVTAVTTHNGAKAEFDAHGKVSSVKFKSSTGYNTKVSRGANGSRTVVSEHVNDRGERTTTVNTGPNRGYVDHTFTRNGRPYLRRTYVAGGKSYAVVYRGYYYGGRPYFAYVPGYYYAPGFYGWAYAPWGAPVAFAWGWGGAPWYGYYGYYFTPYAVYPGPAFWLTDYVVAENLQAAYAAEADNAAVPRQSTGLAFIPVYAAGTKNLAPNFSTAGSVSFFDDRLGLYAGGTSTFAFSIPAGETETIEYGIPTGGYLNNVPVEVSINGVSDAIVDKGLGGLGAGTQRPLPLWRKSFGPGDYVLSFKSGGGAVNFYGLWIGASSVDQTAKSGYNETQSTPTLTLAAKTAIAEEVSANLATEQADSTTTSLPSTAPGNEVPAALDPKQRTFIVSTALSEKTTDGSQCSLSGGDILTRIDNTPDTNQNVTSMVTSSQKNDCASGSMLAVSIQDLQDMHNAFVEKMDAGLKKLASTQGTKGIPPSPAPGQRANLDGQAQPDTTASSDLQQQQKDADSAEKDVNQAVAPGQGN